MSTRAPGKRSSASTSVATPASAASGPMKMPPLRLLVMLLGPPAPRAVLDDGRAAGRAWLALVLARRHRGDAYRLLDPRPFDARALRPWRLALGLSRRRLLALLVALRPAAQATRSVEVSGGGGGGTHGIDVLFFSRSASRPSASAAA